MKKIEELLDKEITFQLRDAIIGSINFASKRADSPCRFPKNYKLNMTFEELSENKVDITNYLHELQIRLYNELKNMVTDDWHVELVLNNAAKSMTTPNLIINIIVSKRSTRFDK